MLISAGPFLKPEILSMEPLFSAKLPSKSQLPQRSMVILLDCSSLSRSGLPVEDLEIPLMVIDHHASGEAAQDLAWIDPSSPSTTLLIQRLMEAAGFEITKQEAQWLFLGFATDTGFFRHLEENCRESLETVARLAQWGINPSLTYRRMTGGKDLASQKLVARGIERAQSYYNGNLLLTWETQADFHELNLTSRDSGTLYQILQTIGGCQVIILLKELEDNQVSVSFRSSTDLNVGEIAQSLGGGGHPKASGCTLQGSLNEVKEQMLELFGRYF